MANTEFWESSACQLLLGMTSVTGPAREMTREVRKSACLKHSLNKTGCSKPDLQANLRANFVSCGRQP